MPPFATASALDLLQQTVDHEGIEGRPRQRLYAIRMLFDRDLAYVESELARATEDGVHPGTDAARHLVGVAGKRVRPLTLLLSAACFGGVSDAARELSVVAELVHSATLLHDDVIDDSPLRSGRPAARAVFGNAVSVLAGDLLLTHALDRTLRAAPAALPDLLRTLRRLVDGELVQLRGRSTLDLGEPSYFRILEDKTASLFGWSARAGALVGGGTPAEIEALGRFGERMGVAFQLVDDALDYAGDTVEMGKALLADLGEGKITLPLILALARDPALSEGLAEARGGSADAAVALGKAVRAMGVCDEVRRRAEAETDRALSALGETRPSPANDLLRALAIELTARAS
jgi:octaprenyl-diphosphate synthase